MRKIMLLAALASSAVLVAQPASAACNAICQSKCDATWQAGGYRNPQACYQVWSVINARHGTSAAAFEGKLKRNKRGKIIIPR